MDPKKIRLIPVTDKDVFPDGRLRSIVRPVHKGHASRKKLHTGHWVKTHGRRHIIRPLSKSELNEDDSLQHLVEDRSSSAEHSKRPWNQTLFEELAIYTDGACYRNGANKHEAQASIGVWFGPEHALNVSKTVELNRRQTNNTAEILAVVEAVKQARVIGALRLRVYSDSKLVVNGWNKSISKWQRDNWKNSAGKPLPNKPEFMLLIDEVAKTSGLNLIMQYVPGHVGNYGNTAADALASAAIERYVDRRNHERWLLDPELPPLEYIKSIFGGHVGSNPLSHKEFLEIRRSCDLAAKRQEARDREEGPSNPLGRLAWKVTTSFNEANNIVRTMEKKGPLPEDVRRRVHREVYEKIRQAQEEKEIASTSKRQGPYPSYDCSAHNQYVPEMPRKEATLSWIERKRRQQEAEAGQRKRKK